jgi:hypothetical protein
MKSSAMNRRIFILNTVTTAALAGARGVFAQPRKHPRLTLTRRNRFQQGKKWIEAWDSVPAPGGGEWTEETIKEFKKSVKDFNEYYKVIKR